VARPSVTEAPHPGRRSRTERRLAARLSGQKKPDHSGSIAPLTLPFVAILVLAAFCLLPQVNSQPALIGSFGLAIGALAVFFLILRASVQRTGRVLSYEFVPNRVHYVQLMMHSSIFVYWGFYWDAVYHQIPLILAQVAFLYALDMLVCWSRRDKWILGFAPFPIVFSTNLFLWFRDDWFWLQFLMIATIVLCKEFVRWDRDGRRTHIFNPSSSALFLFSLGLIIANMTQISWGPEIAVTMERPPQIYFELFILGLIVQGWFSVTLVTLSCAAVMYAFGVAFTHSTGEYYFIDSNIPPAVFLGFHLLVTDPATSPRRMTGKIIFGSLYGVGVIGIYALLGLIHAPQFYDKLLCVPILNLMVRGLDRFSEAFSARSHPLDLLKRWGPRNLNYAHMAIWASLFAVMVSTGFLGRGLSFKAECESDNAASCLQYGKLMTEGGRFPVANAKGGESVARACSLGLQAGCQQLTGFVRTGGLKVFKDACGQDDTLACFISGWVLTDGIGVDRNNEQARHFLDKACKSGFQPACVAPAPATPRR
jgi:hypothetical protein